MAVRAGIVDNLPAATRVVEPATASTPSRIISIYERGFPLGFKGSPELPGTEEGKAYLYHHHRPHTVHCHLPSAHG